MVLASPNFYGLCVNPSDPDHLVLGIDYKMPGKLFLSRDGGALWRGIFYGLPEANASAHASAPGDWAVSSPPEQRPAT